MNILAISHLFPHLEEKRYGIFVARQLSEMHRLGADVTAFVPVVWCPGFLRLFRKWEGYNHKRSLCEHEGLQTVAIPYARPPGNWFNRWAGLFVFQRMKRKASKLHRQEKFDVIYATDFFPDGDAAVRLARHIDVPAACLGIGVDVNITAHTSKIMHRHFVRTAQALDGTLACGRSVADGIEAATGRPSLCVYGVLDLEEFSPAPNKASLRNELGLPSDQIVALYAGYLTKRKGVYELVEAFSGVSNNIPGVLLTMCGGGPEKRGLQMFIRGKNAEHTIRVVGEVEPEQMSKWMKASDLFVLPSHTEGMPNVVMEAMACGLPVVATGVGGLPDAIGDCEGAILVEPRSVDALEQGMLEVIQDEQLRARMTAAARKRAEEQFGVERNARIVLDYLQKVIEEHRAKKLS